MKVVIKELKLSRVGRLLRSSAMEGIEAMLWQWAMEVT